MKKIKNKFKKIKEGILIFLSKHGIYFLSLFFGSFLIFLGVRGIVICLLEEKHIIYLIAGSLQIFLGVFWILNYSFFIKKSYHEDKLEELTSRLEINKDLPFLLKEIKILKRDIRGYHGEIRHLERQYNLVLQYIEYLNIENQSFLSGERLSFEDFKRTRNNQSVYMPDLSLSWDQELMTEEILARQGVVENPETWISLQQEEIRRRIEINWEIITGENQ